VAPWRWAPRPAAASVTSAALSRGPVARPAAGGAPVAAQGWAYVVQAVAWLVAIHRHAAITLWTSGHRADGLRRLALCGAVDLVVAVVGLFVVAMIVSPVLGI
jgi:hypothetical protein